MPEGMKTTKVTVKNRAEPGKGGRQVFFDAHNRQHDLGPGETAEVELPASYAEHLQNLSKAGHGNLQIKGHESKESPTGDKDLDKQVNLDRAALEKAERENAERGTKAQEKMDEEEQRRQILSGMSGGSQPQVRPPGVVVGPAGPGPSAEVGQDGNDPRDMGRAAAGGGHPQAGQTQGRLEQGEPARGPAAGKGAVRGEHAKSGRK
jgi:hypothetical protein